MDEQSQLDRKNINNGSGVNNNNSNEGEKTKEMVLGLPTLPPNRVKSTTFSSVTTYHNSSTVNLGITKAMVKRSQLGLRHPPYKKKKKNINNGRGDNNNNSNEGEKTKEMRLLPPRRGKVSIKMFENLVLCWRTHNLKVQPKGGDGSGGDKDKKGGSGDNDGGDKTEGGGGVGGKMGTKMEPKGQHDDRNRFSYHAGRADPDISGARVILLLLGLVLKK